MGLLFNRKDLGQTYDELIDALGVDIDFLNSEDEKEENKD